MNVRNTLGAVVAIGCVLSSCASTSEYDDASSQTVATKESTVPQWVRDGVALARQSAGIVPGKGTGSDNRPTTGSAGADGSKLPSRETVVPALVASGIPEQQATCIYNGLSSNADVADDAITILKALGGLNPTSSGAGAAGSAPSFNATTLASLGSLKPESSTRILVAIAPCLDSSTLTALLAGGQPGGAGGAGAASFGSIEALLKNVSPAQLAALQGLDPAAVAAAVGSALSQAELAKFQEALAAAQLATAGSQSALGSLALLNGIDLAKLDLTKLPPEQLPLVLYAIIAGLTPAQLTQLTQIAGVNFGKLDLNIDPSKLSPEEIGTLLVVLGPALAASISPRGGTPPPGVDPTQIYIPPGLDLSLINPLLFLDRNDAIAEFVRQGLSPEKGACLIDNYSRLSPATISAFFSSNANPLAISQFLLASLNCLVNNP